ncbi:MAG: hypothetical protein WA919_05540 [Coleofasciculaceae cyanobacterium]
MESVDKLLSQLRAEYQQQDTEIKQKEKLPSPTKQSSSKSAISKAKPQSQQPNWLATAEERLLEEVKAEFKEKEQAEQLKRQEKQREKRLREEKERQEKQLKEQQIQQKKREALTEQATEWLKNLDLHSEVGLWFEEFAYSYPSKLDAAIDYLQALKETQP